MKGKKIINSPERLIPEIMEGFLLASHGALTQVPGANALMRSDMPQDKIALVVGGGSGHEPMYTGFVGDGLADVSVMGNVFAAPTPDNILEATRAVHRGRGVLYVYGNYAGDNMNFDIAAELAQTEGIETRTVRIMDDVAVARHEDRRGIAGAFYQVKIAGSACREADTLDDAAAVVEHARANVRSIGVAVRAGSLPETGKLTFELADDEIEIGMGSHGEPGVERRKLPPADDLAREMTRMVVDDLPFRRGDEVALLLNNLGASTLMELMVVNRTVRAMLDDAGICVRRTDSGAYLTSLEMAGFSVTLLRLDELLAHHVGSPCRSLGLTQGIGA